MLHRLDMNLGQRPIGREGYHEPFGSRPHHEIALRSCHQAGSVPLDEKIGGERESRCAKKVDAQIGAGKPWQHVFRHDGVKDVSSPAHNLKWNESRVHTRKRTPRQSSAVRGNAHITQKYVGTPRLVWGTSAVGNHRLDDRLDQKGMWADSESGGSSMRALGNVFPDKQTRCGVMFFTGPRRRRKEDLWTVLLQADVLTVDPERWVEMVKDAATGKDAVDVGTGIIARVRDDP
jgi:hypothetical protein